jgi:hypothetical protein
MKSFCTFLVIAAYIVGIIYCAEHKHLLTGLFLCVGLFCMPDP